MGSHSAVVQSDTRNTRTNLSPAVLSAYSGVGWQISAEYKWSSIKPCDAEEYRDNAWLIVENETTSNSIQRHHLPPKHCYEVMLIFSMIFITGLAADMAEDVVG